MKRFQLIQFEVTGFLQVSWELSCAYPGCWGCRKTPDFSPKWDDVRPQLCLLWFCFCSGTRAAVAWRKVGCRGPAQAPVTAGDHAGPGYQQLAASQHEKFKLLAAWLAGSNTAWAAYSSGSWPYGEIKNTNIALPWVPTEGPSFRQSFSISSYPYWQGSSTSGRICAGGRGRASLVPELPCAGDGLWGGRNDHANTEGVWGARGAVPLLSCLSGPAPVLLQNITKAVLTNVNVGKCGAGDV